MKSVALIIPAAGSGRRLGHELSKPYIEIAGKTILEHTLLRFAGLDELRQVIVATSAEYLGQAELIMNRTLPESVDCLCAEGGRERQYSVSNALRLVDDAELVAVHDAVRPFIGTGIIKACMYEAAETGGAVVGIRVNDTIKRVDQDLVIRETPDRSMLWQAQTPQIFETKRLKEAYRRALKEGITGTDDSSLVERLGYRVKMVKGEKGNIKITHPADLKLAKILLEE